MLVPVMLLGTGCETAARELQGRLGHFPKMRLRLFTQRLVRAYVSFDKASEQIIAVGTPIAGCPPHRSRRARFAHRAPTSGGLTTNPTKQLRVHSRASGTRLPGAVSGTCV